VRVVQRRQQREAGPRQLGAVGDEQCAALAHDRPQACEERLTAAKSAPVVAGFDVTFCAPKSVSLLHALADGEVSNEVRNAHDAAQRDALAVLERVACRVRRGAGGATVLDADGFVAAAFRHRTSRAADPHLHTHVVIANLAHSPDDGRWTALDARPLYAWLSPVGHLYEAQLRWELTRRLRVEWGPVRNGIADVAGVPKPVLREFSTRRREIEAHLDEHSHTSARAAQLAAYATRTPKDPGADAVSLVAGWWERAEALGFGPRKLAVVLDRSVTVEPPAPGSVEAEELYRWLASPEGLTAKRSTFGERDVIKAICNALPSGGHIDQVLDLVDGFLGSEHVLALTTDPAAATIRRADGKVIAARTDEGCFTTPEMIRIEARLVDTALRRRGTGTGVATPDAVDVAVAARPSLTGEQERMVRAVCSSGHGVEIVEGVAGAGKTYALAAARHAWDASGHRVLGCALAARAAKQLESDAAIPATTLDRLLGAIDTGRQVLDPATVIVVDPTPSTRSALPCGGPGPKTWPLTSSSSVMHSPPGGTTATGSVPSSVAGLLTTAASCAGSSATAATSNTAATTPSGAETSPSTNSPASDRFAGARATPSAAKRSFACDQHSTPSLATTPASPASMPSSPTFSPSRSAVPPGNATTEATSTGSSGSTARSTSPPGSSSMPPERANAMLRVPPLDGHPD